MLQNLNFGSERDRGERRAASHLIFGAIKSWIEKRLSPRRQVDAPVLVLQGSRVQSGQLVDISERGFGLCKVTGLVVDGLVSVATYDGHVLEGRIVWTEGGRAGVRLLSES
jgi:PilZ domain